MNILIFGTDNGFMDAFIRKANKENHKIFLVCDESAHASRPSGVFEMYEFNYNSESLKNIIDSVRPERVVFFGALDTGFCTGNHIEQQSLDYISGLMNILMSCNVSGVRDFIYFSTGEVYESDYTEPIVEDAPLSPISFKSLLLAQAEDIVVRYGNTSDTAVTVIRIDNLYFIPKNRAQAKDFCSKMCLDYLINKRIEYNAQKQLSGIYITDAVEGAYKIICAEKRRYNIYHLASNDGVCEKDIADLILRYGDENIRIIDSTIGAKSHMLDGSRAQAEFGFGIRCTYDKYVPKVLSHIARHLNKFLTDAQKRSRGFMSTLTHNMRRLLSVMRALLENGAVFAIIFIVDFYTQNSSFVEQLDFYLLYVLLFAIIYGRQQAILSAFLSVFGYAFTQSIARGSTFDVLIDYNTYVWIAQLFVVGMTVGHLKEKIGLVGDTKDEEIEYLTVQLSEIEEIDESNKRIKHIYENQIINYTESMGMLYSIISKIDAMETGQVLFSTASTVSEVMNTRDVAVYRVTGDYARLTAFTSEKAKSLGKSIRFGEYGLMSTAFNDNRVFINRMLDGSLPSMAIALYDEEQPELLIMMWGIQIENMTLYRANLLTVLGRIIASTTHRAGQYLDALSNKRYIGNTRVLERDAFEEICKTHIDAAKSGVTENVLITIGGVSPEQADRLLLSKVRSTDYIGQTKNGEIGVLLVNTDTQEADFVKKRFADAEIEILRIQETGRGEAK